MILAAGSSSRMGQPKQLLPWKDSFLLDHAISIAESIQPSKTVVVLGANYERINSKIQHRRIAIKRNSQWEEGLGSSIASGLNFIQNLGDPVDGVLIILPDQPLINVDYLKLMISQFKKNEKQSMASAYETDKFGVPALFDRCYFEELIQLRGDKGAKKVISDNIEKVSALKANHLIVDIDTKEDYKRLFTDNHL